MKLVPPFTAAGNAARYWRPFALTSDGTKSITVVVDLVHQRTVLAHKLAIQLQATLNRLPRED